MAGSRRSAPTNCKRLCELYTGELLEGLVIERCPEFNLWLTGQQSRYAAFRDCASSTARREPARGFRKRLAALEKWVEVAPLMTEAQIELLRRLAGRGRIDACKRQLAAAARLYQAEALDFEPIHKAGRSVRSAAAGGSERAPSRRRRRHQRLAQGPKPCSKAARRPSLAVMPFHALPDRREGIWRNGRRPHARHHYASRQAAELFRHRRGVGLCPWPSTDRPGRRRPTAQRRLCGQRIGAAAGGSARRQRGIDRNRHSEDSLGRGFRLQAGRRLFGHGRHRQPDCRVDRERDRSSRAQSRSAEAARTRSTPGRPITAAFGICTASPRRRTRLPGSFSRWLCGSIRPSPAPMPAFRSPIGRARFSIGAIANSI